MKATGDGRTLGLTPMKVICEQRTDREMPESMIVSQSDDAWHPSRDPDYVEWWYFDLTNVDGSLVRGQFYIIGGVSRPNKVKTGVRASLVKPDLTEILIEQKLPYSSFRSSTEVCDVEIGRNYLKGDLSHYRVHVEAGEKALDLEFDSVIAGFKGQACFGDERKCMIWVVPQPRSHVKGTFTMEEDTLHIEGVGYRDHNWSNISPMNYVSYWDWGRIYDKEFTVIFANIVATRRFGKAEVKPLMVYDSRKLAFLTTEPKKWSLTKRDVKFDPYLRIERPETYLLRARDEELLLEIDLSVEKVFQQIDLIADYNPIVRLFTRTFVADPFAISSLSVGSGRFDFSGQQNALVCTAIHEFVNNRRRRSLV